LKHPLRYFFLALTILTWFSGWSENGSRLWLRFDKIADEQVRSAYEEQIKQIFFEGESPIITTARAELTTALSSLLDRPVSVATNPTERSGIIAGLLDQSDLVTSYVSPDDAANVHADGFVITHVVRHKIQQIVLAAKDDKGILYGVFHLLRMMQTHQSLEKIHVVENPKIQHRILNHWDNLDRTVERGYAGFSIWNWHELPDFIDDRYIEYARANASIGINGAAVTNVNANALVFRSDYLTKAKALADVFRPYGIRLYLTARFSAPIDLGGLPTADPIDASVRQWWKDKADEIYALIPDFGGFLVKANSEGQPGPQDYGRNHAEGANMLADAVAPHDGIVMWRAFVYSSEEPDDRAKQAYDEFVPLDGQFRENVLIQVKNGPIDFQPREPIHPMFGSMPKTPLMMEFQITKEYLGQGTHLVGLAPMFEEILNTDTHAKGKGSYVAKIIDGSLDGHTVTGIAGVSNIGTAPNWTGNLFGQADWFAFGRLAWNPYLKSEIIFDDWIKMTITHGDQAVATINHMLSSSHETCVRYMTPLGLHHIMGPGHHYGPGPWVKNMSRADWTSVYYHKADENGLGFDRTATGSNALSQYHEAFHAQLEDINSCPPEFLLWFHHVPWNHSLSTGRDLWGELCHQYHQGVEEVEQLREDWKSVRDYVDAERYRHVEMHLQIQEKESRWWRDACLTYFQSFSMREIPYHLEQPEHDLPYYESLTFPYAPGIRPRW